mgnify:CR=1 FL=1
MILTVTLNPSVDISYKLENFNLDTVNRVQDVTKTAGGKGLNVARVCTQLGEEVAATGFLGGALGQFIREEIVKIHIQDEFVACSGDTRNCIAILHNGKQTEVLEGGPTITDEKDAFLKAFEELVQKVSLITISGSLPKGLSADFYNELIAIANQASVKVLLDTSGASLESALKVKEKPYFIKPNEEELAALLNVEITNEAELVGALLNPLFNGVEWIAATLGKDGALVRHGDVFYRVHIPTVEVVNPVGSGDSVVAGFASGFSKSYMGEDLLTYALAMGVLNAMEEKTGHIDVEKLESIRQGMRVEEIELPF